MSSTFYNAFDHKEWKAAGLKDFGEFADCVEYVNQSEYGDGQLEGEWYYDDEDTLTVYSGSFGNYNSPGASAYTNANVYDTREDFDRVVALWKGLPEFEDCDECNDCSPAEPEKDDYTTYDYINWYSAGKLVLQTPSPTNPNEAADDWANQVRRHQDAESFWPSVWWVSDHGNCHLLDLGD